MAKEESGTKYHAVHPTEWSPAQRLLKTRFSGIPTLDDVRAWNEALRQAVERMPDGTAFKFLVDIQGYTVADVPKEVHLEQRQVIPLFLADHAFRIGYLGLFDADVTLRTGPRGITCAAVAHIHHECHKMEMYQEKFGRENDRYFCDPAAAEAWISAY